MQKRAVSSTSHYKIESQRFSNYQRYRWDEAWELPGPEDYFLWTLLTIKNKVSELRMAHKFRDSTHYKPHATIVLLLKKKKVGEILQPFNL